MTNNVLRLLAATAALMMLFGSSRAAGPATATSPAASAPASSPATGSKPFLRYSFTVSKETTYITSPLLPDGTVDYVSAMNDELSKGVTADNNAAIPIIKAMGPICLSGTAGAKIAKILGIGDLPKKGDYIIGLTEFMWSQPGKPSANDLMEERHKLAAQPAKKSALHKQLAASIEANSKPLDAIIAASKLPRFYVPMVSAEPEGGMEVLPLSLGQLREAMRILAARAATRAADADYAGASSDLLAIHRLARLLDQRPLLIDHLAAIAIDSQASATEAGIIRSRLWNEKDASDYLRQLQALPEMKFEPAIFDRGERYFTLDFFMCAARDGWDKYFKRYQGLLPETPELGYVLLDFNELLRLENRSFDALAAIAKQPSWPKKKADFDDWTQSTFSYDEFKTSTSQPGIGLGDPGDPLGYGRIRKTLLSHLLSGPKAKARIVFEGLHVMNQVTFRAIEMTGETAMRSRLNQVAMALEIYRLRHGSYPDKLNALTPDIMKSVPDDFFVEQPLKYRPADGGYLLYSAGPDMKDDGGERIKFGDNDIGIEITAPTTTAPAASAPATPATAASEEVRRTDRR